MNTNVILIIFFAFCGYGIYEAFSRESNIDVALKDKNQRERLINDAVKIKSVQIAQMKNLKKKKDEELALLATGANSAHPVSQSKHPSQNDQLKERKFDNIFPNSSVGADLTTLINDLPNHAMSAGPKAEAINEIYKRINAEPVDFFNAVKQGLLNIDDNAHEERRFLVRLVSGINIDPNIKLEFLTEELSRQEALRDVPNTELSESYVVIFDALALLYPKETVAGPIIEKALSIQKDRDPSLAETLRRRYSSILSSP